MVPFNSPNDKRSNDTPHDYGTLKYKITVLRGFKGVLGDQEGSNAQNMVALNSPNDKLSNDTPHDYGTLKYKITVLRGFKGGLKGF
jgi:hypothetical protein